jgi:phage shock protein PspC (stress-responsive transcriptional regulator)
VQNSSTALFSRPDTLFGVCEGIGQDFGFNPIYLRMALAVLVLWNPVAMISIYVALGAAVYLSRWLVPARGARTHQAIAVVPSSDAPTSVGNDEAFAIAA